MRVGFLYQKRDGALQVAAGSREMLKVTRWGVESRRQLPEGMADRPGRETGAAGE